MATVYNLVRWVDENGEHLPNAEEHMPENSVSARASLQALLDHGIVSRTKRFEQPKAKPSTE